MKIFAAIYREIVMGGHLLALGTSSIAATSALLLGMRPSFELLLMAYLFSYGAYMMNRQAEMEQDAVSNPGRTAHLRSRGRYLPMIVGFCFVLGYALAFLVNMIFFTALLIPLALSLIYSVGSKRLIPVIGASKLKERLLVKNLAISLGWSLIPFLVGLYYLRLSNALILLAPFIFLRLMVNTVFFDVRDVGADAKYGVRTIPAVYGVKRSFGWMNLLDLLSAVYLVVALSSSLLPSSAGLLLFLPAYSFIYRRAANDQSRINFLCDFIADAEYMLWGPLTYAGKVFV